MNEQNPPINRCVGIIQPNIPFQIPSESHIRITNFTILSDDDTLSGSRTTIMANVKALTSDKREVEMNVAVSSFIIGIDYDQSCNLIISPTDQCTLTIVGTNVPIQMIYYYI
ncbi:hypothetical protein M9Y10_016480 [Tritrichomonas musculus]|uniref:Uncharacterized protein n=1 Tax=Tritrichomonas musculus TaxID=1915356 RepID=A0ABR2HXX3_9EUKA